MRFFYSKTNLHKKYHITNASKFFLGKLMNISEDRREKWRLRDVLYSYILLYILIIVLVITTSFVLKNLDLHLNEIEENVLLKFLNYASLLPAIWFLINRYPIINKRSLIFFNRDYLKPFIIGIASCGIISIILILNASGEIVPSMMLIINSKGAYHIFFLINLLFVVPFIEELYYRGLVFTILKNRFDFFWGIAITTLLFSFGHPRSWLNAGILSIIYTLVFEKTNCLLFSILTHSIYNGMAIVSALITYYYF